MVESQSRSFQEPGTLVSVAYQRLLTTLDVEICRLFLGGLAVKVRGFAEKNPIVPRACFVYHIKWPLIEESHRSGTTQNG
mmetsp:Transcript_15942/g.28895  ORF Transcript_15942/g.28895 Transcript_15942/m.28895 type:complete len:80 (+) Transcript_15942:301-540(+)